MGAVLILMQDKKSFFAGDGCNPFSSEEKKPDLR